MGRMTAFSLHRRYLLPLAAGLLSLFVVSCETSKTPKTGYHDVVDYTSPNTGLSQEEYPFDKDGNYLADVVSGKKKGKPASSSSSSYKPAEEPIPYSSTSGSSYSDTYEKPVITAVDTPSTRRNPIYEKVPEPDSSKPASSSSGSSTKSKPASYTSSSSSSSASKSKPSTTSKTSTASKTTASKTTAKPTVAASKTSASKSKAKPEPVKAKPKAAAAPKPTYASVKVKSGDTLYGLANRYNTSVAAIKQANGMSSNTLVNGRTLRIPKK